MLTGVILAAQQVGPQKSRQFAGRITSRAILALKSFFIQLPYGPFHIYKLVRPAGQW